MKEKKIKMKVVEVKTKSSVPLWYFTDRILTIKRWIYLWEQFVWDNMWWKLYLYHFNLIFDEKIDNDVIKKCINSWFNNWINIYSTLWRISIKKIEVTNMELNKLIKFNEIIFENSKKNK